MSGGWIKMEKSLRDDPRVLKMARDLRNADVTLHSLNRAALVTLVLGSLFQFWSYADSHIREDDTLAIGTDEVDEVVGLRGFSQILPPNWLEIVGPECVKLPDFHDHNGIEARKKAQTQKRVARHREKVALESYKGKRSGNDSVTPSALPDLDLDLDSDLDLDKTKKEKKRVPTEPVEPERSTALVMAPKATEVVAEAVERVFAHWCEIHRHPHAKLDEKRRKVIKRALQHYSDADLCHAISGYRNSPHHMGQNDRATVYDDIELMLRDSKHIDAGLKFHADPPRTDLSALTRRNVDATADWVPPEMRTGS